MLEDFILREIGALTRNIHAIAEVKFKSLALKKGQSIYLTRICENPGITLKDLARLLVVDKTTASKVVGKLVSQDLVNKAQDKKDKRAFLLFPTLKAQKAYEFIIKEENRLTEQCYLGFDRQHRRTILGLVRKMRRNIEDDWYALKNHKKSSVVE